MDDHSQEASTQHEDVSSGESWDALTRETLSSPPRPAISLSKGLLLSGLAGLLIVVMIVGTVALIKGSQGGQSDRTAGTSPTATPSATATATVRATATSSVFSPTANGWTTYTAGVAGGRVTGGDLQFSASSPQRGYVCGVDNAGDIIFGTTTDGGQTWRVGRSPAANDGCSLQVSPTNALDVALTSVPGSCGGDACFSSDAHYSTDGGTTWTAAPIPPNTVQVGGALWSGAYRYVWAGTLEKGLQQSSFLTASANGGPFTSINVSTLLPGAQDVSVGSVVAGGTTLYLNLTYSGCSSPTCQAIVASGDGGKTWAQIPNQSNIQLQAVEGTTLYGQITGVQPPKPVLSSDDGTTWTTQALPPLPDGRSAGLCVPAPDGSCVTVTPSGVAYLSDGAWTILPFPAEDLDVAAAVGPSGHAQRIWAIDRGNDYLAGIYWHTLP